MKNMLNMMVIVLLILISSMIISFAYFATFITNTETDTTIYTSTGFLSIDYDGGAFISATYMMPQEDAWMIKNFTLIGNNKTTLNLEYHILLITTINTFTSGALTFTLEGVNNNSNGEVLNILDQIPIETGSAETFIGNGKFVGKINDKMHSYTLKIYFPNTNENQNENFNKEFSAYVDVKPGNITLTNTILADYEKIIEAPSSIFSSLSASDENKMYYSEDNYGISYFFRGANSFVKNNIIFANNQWKIVRINGNNTIKLIYNGACPNNNCEINTSHTIINPIIVSYNSNSDDNKYVGYMYGGLNGTSSTSRIEATTNETSSTIKSSLEAWYENNILETIYEKYIVDTLFCNDRQFRNELGGAATGTGFGTSSTIYGSYYRLTTKKVPTYICAIKNDRFTTYDTIIGNGDLTYPVGLLTADELYFAGYLNNQYTNDNFLYLSDTYFTISPGRYNNKAYIYAQNNLGGVSPVASSGSFTLRPVINITSNVKVTGTGTLLDPYIVE